ncbi:hypothetical protein HDU96_008306 [Phlyctochytrium bullatum]|nr:hypothetical protein HDU96_008306 [Phlyctochytrium bullatum]
MLGDGLHQFSHMHEITNHIAPQDPADKLQATAGWEASIDPDEIEIYNTVHENDKATIVKGLYRNDSVIIKYSSRRGIIDREIEFLRRASPGEVVVAYVGWFQIDEGFKGLVMQKCALNLKMWSEKATRTADIDDKLLHISEGIGKGLAHINSLGIIHNDIKPQNVFLDVFNKPFIGDFGVATNRGEERVGYSPQYFDKESLEVIPDEKSDSWLLGATLWELWSNEPFDVDEEVYLDHIGNVIIKDILKKLLRPRDRRSIAERILKLFNSTTVRPAYNTLKPGNLNPTPPRLNLPLRNISTQQPSTPSLGASYPLPFEGEPVADVTKQFWDALEAEKTADVRKILSESIIEVDSAKDGLTGLQFACRRNLTDIVKLLLEYGADYQRADASGSFPIQLSTSVNVWRAIAPKMPVPPYDLFDAALRGDDVGTRLILAAEKNPLTKLRQQKMMELGDLARSVTPLHAAAYEGNAVICEILLKFGAEVDARDNYAWTPLSYSAYVGSTEVTRLLLRKGADLESMAESNLTPLMLAVFKGRLDVAALLVDEGPNVETKNESGQTSLHIAAEEGKVEVARFLLDKGVDIESRGEHGRTPLHIAAECGNLDVVHLLIERGAVIESKDKNSDTPLIHAAFDSHIRVVDLLIENGAEIECKNLQEQTPLHAASINGHVDLARRLLEKGADIESRDLDMATPLMKAAFAGHLEVVKLLVEEGADIFAGDSRLKTARNWAVVQQHRAVAEFLALLANDPLHKYWMALAAGDIGALKSILSSNSNEINSSRNGRTGLHLACSKNLVDVVKLLVQFGADHNKTDRFGKLPLQLSTSVDVWRALASKMPTPSIDLFDAAQILDDVSARLILAAEKDPIVKLHARDEMLLGTMKRIVTPLHVAAYHGAMAICQVFLHCGADVNAGDKHKWTPLFFSALGGSLDVARLLLKNGANIKCMADDDRTALHIAAECGKVKVARVLLEEGAEVDTSDKYGKTPLIYAALNGRTEVVQLLLANGADIEGDAAQSEGTLLHIAAKSGHATMARLLVEHSADMESRTFLHQTPLHTAANYGNVDVARVLLEKGAELESRNYLNQTPLHIAAEFGKEEVVRLFLEKGAEMECKDSKKDTVLIKAALNGDPKIVELLIEKGANVQGGDDHDRTPLHTAAQFGKVGAARLLLDKGALIESRNSLKQTPLHIAAIHGQLAVARLLLAKGADMESRDEEKSTPLILASCWGRADIVNLLVERGADIGAQDKYLKTARDWALEGHHVAVAKALAAEG